MDVFVARQPIFDKNKDIYAYELLFRTGENNGFPDIDGETATSSLLSSSFFTVGIDKVGAGKKTFINFTEDLLAKGTPQMFPPQKLVVEILETVTPTQQIVASCQKLKEQNYELALDDFVYSNSFDSLLDLADIIKIDFRLTPVETLAEMLHKLKAFNCRLLAEKVETYQEFNAALELGFDYFQGYFFSKPEVLKNKDLSTSNINILRLISQINSADFDPDALEEIILQDVSISYKLLSYINSAHFSRIQPIKSIKQAISYLGEKPLKLFVSLIATSKLAEDKPQELLTTAIIRARFLELIGNECGDNSEELFLLGLFSCLEAMLDKRIESILSKLPLSEQINQTLIKREGNLYTYLRLIEAYEAGNWIALRFAKKKLGLAEEKILAAYVDALAWADAF